MKRQASGADEENKRLRSVFNETAEEFLCAITMALPVDPVTAQDGHVYERSAITDWIAQGNGKSPKTNEPMGPALLPAPQVKAMIRGMVESGALSGDKAEAWQEKLEDEEKVRQTREEAERGNAVAMFNMGNMYLQGVFGLREDAPEAFRWFQRCADVGDADGLASLGQCCLFGWGVEENKARGMAYSVMGAERGSQIGCFHLGHALAYGSTVCPRTSCRRRGGGARWTSARMVRRRFRTSSLLPRGCASTPPTSMLAQRSSGARRNYTHFTAQDTAGFMRRYRRTLGFKNLKFTPLQKGKFTSTLTTDRKSTRLNSSH